MILVFLKARSAAQSKFSMVKLSGNDSRGVFSANPLMLEIRLLIVSPPGSSVICVSLMKSIIMTSYPDRLLKLKSSGRAVSEDPENISLADVTFLPSMKSSGNSVICVPANMPLTLVSVFSTPSTSRSMPAGYSVSPLFLNMFAVVVVPAFKWKSSGRDANEVQFSKALV